jgi:hypothetical protein
MPQRRQAGDSYGVRMFFEGVGGDQFNAYLADLREAGYSLKGVVYYTEVEGEEHADERAARGEYDAVVATKTPKVVTVTVPSSSGDTVTFDIDGLTQAESDAMPGMDDFLNASTSPQIIGPDGQVIEATPVSWPAEWADRVPAPEGCTLGANGIMTSSPGSLYVACGYPDEDPAHHAAIVAAYKAQLVAAGFTVTREQAGQDGGLAMILLEKGTIRITIMAGSPDWMTITVTART